MHHFFPQNIAHTILSGFALNNRNLFIRLKGNQWTKWMITLLKKLDFFEWIGIELWVKDRSALRAMIKELEDLKPLRFLEIRMEYDGKRFPKGLGKLKQLRGLSLYRTKMWAVPADFEELEKLEFLDLRNSKLKHIPSFLFSMKQLKTLNLNRNQIRELPDLGQENLFLETLKLASNPILTLPDSFLHLSSLKNLDLSKCDELVSFPMALRTKTGLESINLKGTQVQRFLEFYDLFEPFCKVEIEDINDFAMFLEFQKVQDNLTEDLRSKLNWILVQIFNAPTLVIHAEKQSASLNLVINQFAELIQSDLLEFYFDEEPIPNNLFKLNHLKHIALNFRGEFPGFPMSMAFFDTTYFSSNRATENFTHLNNFIRSKAGTVFFNGVKKGNYQWNKSHQLDFLKLFSKDIYRRKESFINPLKNLEKTEFAVCFLTQISESLQPLADSCEQLEIITEDPEAEKCPVFYFIHPNLEASSVYDKSLHIENIIVEFQLKEWIKTYEKSQIPDLQEHQEMLNNIDELLLSKQEVNVMLGIELIKSLGYPKPAHLNMALAAFFTLRDEAVKKSAETLLLKYLEIENWEKVKESGYISPIIKPLLPFYRVNSFNVWSNIFRTIYTKQGHGQSLGLIFEDDFYIPNELEFLSETTNLTLTFRRKIKSEDDFSKLSVFKNLRALNIYSDSPRLFPVKILKIVSAERVSFSNITPFAAADEKLEINSVKWINARWINQQKINFDTSHFPQLMQLVLSGSGIKNLKFSKLSQLDRLDINIEQKADYPTGIDQLNNLKTLSLKGFDMAEIPNEIYILSQLKALVLQRNKIHKFPTGLHQLLHLETINLDNNLIENIPWSCPSFPKLHTLHLNGNKLTEFPNALGISPILRTLLLRNNKISSINIGKHRFPALGSIDLTGNNLVSLPILENKLPKVTSLNLSHNKIHYLPPAYIKRFLQKGSLHLTSNQLTYLTMPTVIEVEKASGRLYLQKNEISESLKAVYKAKFGNRVVF